jgi:hypothetical protein
MQAVAVAEVTALADLVQFQAEMAAADAAAAELLAACQAQLTLAEVVAVVDILTMLPALVVPG